LSADRKEELVQLKLEQDDVQWSQSVSFEALQDPKGLLESFQLQDPMLKALLSPLVSQLQGYTTNLEASSSAASIADRSQWEAFSDWMSIAHSRLRIYRIESSPEAPADVSVTVNRAGEILSVVLPQRITLKNEGILGL